MRIQETKVYTFSELNDAAKERARDWYRELVFSDSNDWEFVYQDAEQVAAMLGIDIAQRTYRTIGGGASSEPTIYFSGFCSQGDGACFEGSYAYKPGALKAIKEFAPKDTELHRIAAGLQEVQRRHFYRLVATCTHRGHYSHSGCMAVEVEDRANPYADIGGAETDVRDLLRSFADWIYGQLEAEYTWQSADEQVDDAMTANEFEFTEEGERV